MTLGTTQVDERLMRVLAAGDGARAGPDQDQAAPIDGSRYRLPDGGRNSFSAVVFDYRQTLFQVEDESSWIMAASLRTGRGLEPLEVEDIRIRINAVKKDPVVLRTQRGRDRSSGAHRAATTTWLTCAGLDAELVDALYERLCGPESWCPYADTAAVLKELRRRRIPVGVLSNTGWDLRPTFAHHRLRNYVDTFVLSCEQAREKPDPRLFWLACTRLGAGPARVLMVGDDPVADGGAVRVGMPTLLLPPGAAPGTVRGLASVLELVRDDQPDD